MTTCKSCLYPTSKPDLHFIDGECAACRNYRDRSDIDWASRKASLISVLESTPRNGSGYDCIVPSSGGKDSTYQVAELMTLGVRPLVITSATCHLTDVGRRNIDNLARYATTIEYNPNRRARAKLNKLGLELVGDISLPEHFAIFSIPFRAAVDFGIPLIVYGECPTREYGGPPDSADHAAMTRRYIMEHQGFLGMRPSDFVGLDGISALDMKDYMLPPDDKLSGVNAIFLGQYIPWDSRRNASVSIAMGMEARLPCIGNWWDFENLDNAQTGIHDYFGYLKYGYSRGAAQMSVDIRSGFMTREEAVTEMVPRDGAFPWEYMGVKYEDVLYRLDMTTDAFWGTARKFTNGAIFNGVRPKPVALTR